MLITPRQENLNKVVILNPKGGCGKSTLATNLAALYARDKSTPAVMDYDPQGSAMAWLERRPEDLPPIHGIAAYKKTMQATRSWQLRVPVETETLLIDSPASIDHDDLRELTRDATSILVPVLPSSMDIHAASRCIADLLLVGSQPHTQEHQELRQTDAFSGFPWHSDCRRFARHAKLCALGRTGPRHL